jgi:predicted secreted protein
MTEARIGWGGELWLATDNTEATLAELAEITNCGFPQDEADEHEVTHLKSPGRRKEFIQGLIDGGEFTATGNYVPGAATDLLLTAAKSDGTTRKARIVIPDESGTGAADWNMTFSVFVKRYAPDTMEPNAPITFTAVFRVTGDVEQGAGETGS